jgi:hypothetical protein
MILSRVMLSSIVLATSVFVAPPVFAAGQVRLEVAGGSPMTFQEWTQSLGRAGVRNVRLRGAEPGDKPAIDVQGTERSPIYVVTGVIDAQDRIVVPGAAFGRGDAKQLAAWLDDLAKNGPPNLRPRKSAFGLTAEQLAKVHDDLAKPVGFSTKGMGRGDAVEKIGRQLSLPLRSGDPLGAEPIDEDLSDLASGTALAAILRPLGYCLLPHAGDGGLSYTVAKAELGHEVWPIGWPPEKPVAEVLPEIFEFRNVNVQNVPVTRVLAAVGGKLQVPVLLDHNAIARHGLEPEKKLVSHPNHRTNYSVALRRMLFQAGLKFEVRVDEAGKPFLWVTSVKPV